MMIFRGEEEGARAVLDRLVQLAPQVFPAVRIEDDWKAALAQARDALNRKGMGQ